MSPIVLWASKPTPCTEPYHHYAASRTALVIEHDGIGLVHQGQSRTDGTWESGSCIAHFFIDLRREYLFRVGATHVYYDGPHCIWRLGPFGFTTETRDCAKCRGEK